MVETVIETLSALTFDWDDTDWELAAGLLSDLDDDPIQVPDGPLEDPYERRFYRAVEELQRAWREFHG